MRLEGTKCNNCGKIEPENSFPPGWITIQYDTGLIKWNANSTNDKHEAENTVELTDDMDFCSENCLTLYITTKLSRGENTNETK